MSEWLNKLADRMMEFLWPLVLLVMIPSLLLLAGFLLVCAFLVLCQCMGAIYV